MPSGNHLEEKEKQRIMNYVCARMMTGQSLREILSSDEYQSGKNCTVVNRSTIYNICKNQPYADQYATAKTIRHDELFEQLMDIANENNADVETYKDKSGKTRIRINGEVVQRSKLKIDTIKWMLGVLNPDRFGNKQKLDVKVETEQPLFSKPDKKPRL